MFHHSAHKAKILKGNFTVLFFPHSFLASLRSKKKDSNCDLIAVVIPSCNFQSATHIGTRTIRRESSIFSLIRLMGRSRHLVSMSCCFNLFLWLPLCSVSETTCESFVIRLWGQLIHLPRVWRCTYMTANTGAIVIYRFFFLRKSNIFGQEWGMFGFSVPFHPKYFFAFFPSLACDFLASWSMSFLSQVHSSRFLRTLFPSKRETWTLQNVQGARSENSCAILTQHIRPNLSRFFSLSSSFFPRDGLSCQRQKLDFLWGKYPKDNR